MAIRKPSLANIAASTSTASSNGSAVMTSTSSAGNTGGMYASSSAGTATPYPHNINSGQYTITTVGSGFSNAGTSYNPSYELKTVCGTIHTGLYSDVAWNLLSLYYSKHSLLDNVPDNVPQHLGFCFNTWRQEDNEICVSASVPDTYFNHTWLKASYSEDYNAGEIQISAKEILSQLGASCMGYIKPDDNPYQCIASYLLYGHDKTCKLFGKKMVSMVIGKPLNQLEIELKATIKEELDKMSKKLEAQRKQLDNDKEDEMLSLRGKIIKKYEDKRKRLLLKMVSDKRKLRKSLLSGIGKQSKTAKKLIKEAIPLTHSASPDPFSFDNDIGFQCDNILNGSYISSAFKSPLVTNIAANNSASQTIANP